MIRMSEMVLPGHPDKFCDQVADSILKHCQQVDPYAYCQVEVSVWYDKIWLSGGIVTTYSLPLSLEEIVRETGFQIGYTNGNFIDVTKYKISNTVCQQVADPRQWVQKVNDQCISIGYAGYDQKTHYLPPEHFLGHVLRLAISESFKSGPLQAQGPDGKLLVRMREESEGWIVEHILVTLQQKEETKFIDLCNMTEETLKNAYQILKDADARWRRPWKEISLMVNPNGPLINGGSDGDNGQTGRKLVMDYYGPRVPIGGGALSGKDLSHIDRAAAYSTREAAVRAVQTGARECRVTLAYAPNVDDPLDIDYRMDGMGERKEKSFFRHDNMYDRYRGVIIESALSQGGHFFEPEYLWNGMMESA